MPDKTTKVILAAIALGLLLNAVTPLTHPRSVQADGPFTCSGEIKVNAWGASEPSIGGYKVSLDCSSK